MPHVIILQLETSATKISLIDSVTYTQRRT